MGRLSAAIGFAIVSWTPLAAAANTGMCVEPTLARLALSPELAADVVDSPSAASAALNEDADEEGLEQQPLAGPRRGAAQHGDPHGHQDDSDVPWCASPDDPRCSPLPPASDPRRIETRTLFQAVDEAVTARLWPRDEPAAVPGDGLCQAAGVVQRLERPPRASRRARV